MADRKYTIGRPTQDVRLRNWPAGKVAQFKRAIELLETELNTAMASQIDQGVKRLVSTRVPRVTGLTVTAGFKSFQISFNPAKGIDNLLFYEIQKSNNASFSAPTTFTIPQTTITIPTAEERETIYIRVRIMNSHFQVGPWSSTVSAVGSSNFRINTIRGARTTLEIEEADFNTWIDVQTVSISVATSALSVSVQPGLVTLMSEDHSSSPPARQFTTTHTAKFRLLKNGVEVTNAGQCYIENTSTYRNNGGESENSEIKEEKTTFGVLVSPLETFNNETVTYTIQAFIRQDTSTENTFSFNDITASFIALIDNPLIVIDNFDVLEIIQVQ